MSMERYERRLKQVEPIAEQESTYEVPKFLEKTDSSDSVGSLARRTASNGKAKMVNGDKMSSLEESPEKNGCKKDEGLGDSIDQQSEESNSRPGSNGIRNAAYEPVPEEKTEEDSTTKEETEDKSEITLDPSKLPDIGGEDDPNGVFSRKQGPSKKVSFYGNNSEGKEGEEGTEDKYVYDGKSK